METQLLAPVPMRPIRNQGTPVLSGRAAASTVAVRSPQLSQVALEQMVADAENQRMASLRRAAENVNPYPLGNMRFTIYKDMSGQYITRFTSLIDGKVTYIPEPNVMSWLNSGGGGEPALELNV